MQRNRGGKKMPELPEMENYRLQLNQMVINKIIKDVIINREKSINVPPDSFVKKVKGQSISRIERRAKYLLFHLQNKQVLLLHLMLGGWMFFGRKEDKPKRTIQLQLSFGEKHLYFIGLRLGYLHLHTDTELKELFAPLGPEPLQNSFTAEFLTKRIKGRKGRIKSLLLDQEFIAGIGNRYSDEICFEAGILPNRKVESLSSNQVLRLFHSIKEVLMRAAASGGYMDQPLYPLDTKTGRYFKSLKVHGRANEACIRCGSPIQEGTISSRKTFYCAICQK
jgi:formamidopyrimidine-DNA glycosylase